MTGVNFLVQAANDFYKYAKLLAESKKRNAERFWI
jgi:hypothetical protein